MLFFGALMADTASAGLLANLLKMIAVVSRFHFETTKKQFNLLLKHLS